ncbi:MAG: Hpt domain-containing protein [Oscillospiraceae bacterium]|jgi:HPt (histidine-containing phosphotransfer) domain-containing protein|nr:Hpt domain-containing protein [Oscillospiraceae bacterium]
MASYSDYINLEEGLGRIGGNKKIFGTLLDSFARNKSYDELCGALEAGDLPAAAAAAHAIKGMTANLSMTALYSASAELEQALKAGDNNTALFEKVREAREKTLAAIEPCKQDLV